MNQRRLARKTFAVSRMSEFTTQAELTKQIGHSIADWLEVAVKELVDNAIDDSEEGSLPPKVEVAVDTAAHTITVTDSGRGIPAATVKALCDLSMRVSSRAAYVAPTRGQQGNALQTILAMPCALDRNAPGHVTIDAKGIEHRIAFEVDPLREIPYPRYERQPSLVKNGTRTTLTWPDSACSILEGARGRFLQIADEFTWLNPHLTLSVAWDGRRYIGFRASDPGWVKWRPSDPTPPYWYDEARLRRLMAAYIARDQDHGRAPRTVREFVSEFRGLSGTAKQKAVLEKIGAARLSLPEFFGNGDHKRIGKLLDVMRRESRPVKPKDLGCIGSEHLEAHSRAAGADFETFKYRRMFGQNDGVPDVIEAAFAYCPEGENERRIITGVNWSPAINNPFRRHPRNLQSFERGAAATRPRGVQGNA